MLHVEKPARSALDGTDSLQLTDITADAARLPGFDGHEQVWLGRDRARGLTAIVAIHDTTLGPALGGTRIWAHDTLDAAITDALRLSRGMTCKSAIAGVPFGGGKAVIRADARTQKTPELLEAYADMLAALQDRFFTGEDVGLTVADADFLRQHTPNVAGTTIGGSGNPSPVTALGVFLGLKAAVRHRYGSDVTGELTIAVQGLGSVGWALCEMLHETGAHLTVTDIDQARCRQAGDRFGAIIVAPDAILQADADILAPCALGGVLTPGTIADLKAGIVAGSANNQLADEADAERLQARGVLYAPDYVINAGGLINVAAELAPGGYDREDALARVDHIDDILTTIFRRGDETGEPTNRIAEAIAAERLARAKV